MPIGVYERTEYHRGVNHPGWKGEKVSYGALHRWLERNFGRPKICDNCGTIDESKRYDWANISGRHERVRENWKRLCRKCHKVYDKQYGEGNGRAKLTEKQVLEIRKIHQESKAEHRFLGKMFGVAHTTIGLILRRKIWRHI